MTACGEAVFNSLQLPVLEAEVKARLSGLDIERLRSDREHRLAEAIRLGWSATVIERLREDLRDAASEAKELQAVRAHLDQVVGLIGQARRAGVHTYLRFMGD